MQDLFVTHAIHKFLSYSLIKDKHPSDGFSVHPLVHLWLRERLTLEEQRDLSYEALLVLYKAFKSARRSEYAWFFEERVTPHLDALFGNIRRYHFTSNQDQDEIIKAPEMHNCHRRRINVFLDKAQGLYLWGRAGLEEVSLYLWQYIRSNPELGLKAWQLLYRLASVYRYPDLLSSAEILYRSVLREALQQISMKHPQALDILGDLAWAIHQQGQTNEAHDWYIWILAARQDVLGKHHPATMGAVSGLGFVCEAMGLYDQAYELHLRAFTERNKTLGPNDYLTTNTMRGIIDALEATGRFNESLKWHLEKLHRERTCIPASNFEIVGPMFHAARVHRKLGQYREAEQLLLQIVDAIEYVENKVTVTYQNKLVSEVIAELYAEQGHEKEALIWYERALGEVGQLTGEIDPDTELIRFGNIIAQLCEKLGELDKALQTYVQITSKRITSPRRDINSATYESRNRIEEMALLGIERIIDEGSQSANAILYLEELLNLVENGDHFSRILFVLLGKAFSMREQYDKSLQQYEKAALWDMENALVDTVPHLSLLDGISYSMWRLGRYHDALETYQHVLKLSRQLYYDDAFPVQSAMENLARCNFELEDFEHAREWWNRILSRPIANPRLIIALEEDIDGFIEIGRLRDAEELLYLLEDSRTDTSTLCLKRETLFDERSCSAY